MAVDRDDLRQVLNNSQRIYKNIFEGRNIPFVNQYVTKNLRYPTSVDMRKLDISQHMWTVGDRYWKLSAQFYGDPEYWWVIAWFNQKPTEAHVNIGDIVLLPSPLEDVLAMYGI